MKTQVKVNQTQKYIDNQGTHLICKGKLMLIDVYKCDTKIPVKGNITTAKGIFKPIIISEIEEIKVDDKYLYKQGFLDGTVKHYNDYKNAGWIISIATKGDLPYINRAVTGKNAELGLRGVFKILATQEQLSPRHLQAITNGKLRNGDEVDVNCDSKAIRKDGHPFYLENGLYLARDEHGQECLESKEAKEIINTVHTSSKGYITIFLIKQSVEEAAKEYELNEDNIYIAQAFIAGAKWKKSQ